MTDKIAIAWYQRWWRYWASYFWTTYYDQTAQEMALTKENKQLKQLLESAQQERQSCQVELEKLRGILLIKDTMIAALGEVIESLRQHREADVQVDAVRLAAVAKIKELGV